MIRSLSLFNNICSLCVCVCVYVCVCVCVCVCVSVWLCSLCNCIGILYACANLHGWVHMYYFSCSRCSSGSILCCSDGLFEADLWTCAATSRGWRDSSVPAEPGWPPLVYSSAGTSFFPQPQDTHCYCRQCLAFTECLTCLENVNGWNHQRMVGRDAWLAERWLQCLNVQTLQMWDHSNFVWWWSVSDSAHWCWRCTH